MAANSAIEWTQATWNPLAGCTRVSAGCDHCYAATMTARLEAMGQAKYAGLTVLNGKGERHFNGVVRTDEVALTIPLRRRKPTTYFVNSMSDLFHKDVPIEFIDKVFAVMALCPQHTFQVLTKRPEWMAEYLAKPDRKYDIHAAMQRLCSTLNDGTVPAKLDPLLGRKFIVPRRVWAEAPAFPTGVQWPLPNVWLGVSCEDQATFDARVPHLLRCPAVVRFLSCEPLLGPIDTREIDVRADSDVSREWAEPLRGKVASKSPTHGLREFDAPRIHWVIVGGESGPKARPCDVRWIRSIVQQCKAAGVPCFVKQLGREVALANDSFSEWPRGGDGLIQCDNDPRDAYTFQGETTYARLNDPKGGDMAEWPEDLRVREMPGVPND